MAKHGKKFTDTLKKAPKEPVALADAIAFIKANPGAKFDETVEVAMHLGVDLNKSDQSIRGTVTLPNGTGKKVRVIVFAAGTQADDAKAAGATEAGVDELIEKIKGGWMDFDVAIATTEAMKEVRKIARVLGPRGLMPNPKTGTVTDDVVAGVKAAMAGRVEFRMDRTGNVSVPAGKLSFEPKKLEENILTIVKTIRSERPASVKGVFIRSITISSTMGVGVPVLHQADAAAE